MDMLERLHMHATYNWGMSPTDSYIMFGSYGMMIHIINHNPAQKIHVPNYIRSYCIAQNQLHT